MPCPQPDPSPDDKLHRRWLASLMPLYPTCPERPGLAASTAATVPAWQMRRQHRCEWRGGGGGWQSGAKSLCNQRVWLGGDGGSAGTQTFTIGQAVLVNRSGCTKEAGWIIDRMQEDLALGDFGALILAEREWEHMGGGEKLSWC